MQYRTHRRRVGIYSGLLQAEAASVRLFLFVSHVRPTGLNVLGYQSNVLQCCHLLPMVTMVTKDRSISPRSSPRVCIAMQVQHSDTLSTNHDIEFYLLLLTFSRCPLRKQEHNKKSSCQNSNKSSKWDLY